ncbi:hypothetical protein [Falsiroseomonas sp. HW251]|uniref:hypothetical protein n=1 Tax=Falsiroseomonas sp. HW251 TaxID=3390998 RepID=UPI003D3112DB
MKLTGDDDDYSATLDAVRRELLIAHRSVDRHLIPMWTIYGPDTVDFPDLFVAALWVAWPTPKASGVLLRVVSLEDVRALLPSLTCIPRREDDDPNVIET